MTQELVDPKTNYLSAMDALDDKSLIEEMKGVISKTWVYSFMQGGKEVIGLSKVGVDQACREMAKKGEVVREEDVTFESDPIDPDFFLFKASATRVIVSKDSGEIVLDKAIGTKRQGIKQGSKDNPFWYEQGCMKALRNARVRLISEEVRTAIITLAKKEGRAKKLNEEEKDMPMPKSKSGTKEAPPTNPPQEERGDPGTEPCINLKQAGLWHGECKNTGKDEAQRKDYLFKSFKIYSSKHIPLVSFDMALEWARDKSTTKTTS